MIRRNRLIRPAQIHQRIAQIVKSARIVRIHAERRAKRIGRPGQAASLRQHHSQIIMKLRLTRKRPDRIGNHFCRKFTSPRLMGGKTQHVQRIRMAWHHGQNLPVNCLRLRQSPALVVLEAECKCFRNSHSRRLEHSIARHALHICQ